MILRPVEDFVEKLIEYEKHLIIFNDYLTFPEALRVVSEILLDLDSSPYYGDLYSHEPVSYCMKSNIIKGERFRVLHSVRVPQVGIEDLDEYTNEEIETMWHEITLAEMDDAHIEVSGILLIKWVCPICGWEHKQEIPIEEINKRASSTCWRCGCMSIDVGVISPGGMIWR